MKKYFSTLFQSFYKPEIYREAIVNWQGFGGKYLAFIGLILTFMLTASLVVSVYYFQKNDLPYLVKQVPVMEINNGIITVKGKQPAYIESRDKKIKITIDTTKSENQLRQEKVQIGIGKDFMFATDHQGSDRSFDLKKIEGKFVITQRALYRLWDRNITTLQLIAVPFLWLGQFIDLIIECVVIALLSYMVTAFMTEEYNFLTRMRLAALAITPAEILTTFLKTAVNHQPQPWLVLLVACLYIYVMIILMRKLPPVEPLEAAI